MKKILLSLSVIFTFLFYVLSQKMESSGVKVNSPQNSQSTTPAQSTNSLFQQSAQAPTAPAASSAPSSGSRYKDGTFTGNVADAYYGYIQVQTVISNGKISDVKFLQYPNDRNTSIEINSQAMPYLQQEAISAQSANVDIVSGATMSSLAFRESLQFALDQAKI